MYIDTLSPLSLYPSYTLTKNLAGTEMTVLERQRARVMRQGQKVHDAGSSLDAGRFHELLMLGGDVFNQKTVKSDPRWPKLRGSEVRSTVCNGKRKFDKVHRLFFCTYN